MTESDNMRAMTAEDRPYILEMMRKFYATDAVMTNGSERIFEKDIDECLSDSPYLNGFIFTDKEDRIKGYAMIAHSYSTEFGRPCIWIEDIYIESEWRGTGIASEFLDYLKAQYPDAINKLEIEEENTRAVNVYQNNGFKKMSYHEMIRYADPPDSDDVI